MAEKLVVLIANVGERDLYYNVRSEEDPHFCCFEQGKEDERAAANCLKCRLGSRYLACKILERLEKPDQYPNEWRRLHYPILKTVLDEFPCSSVVDKLILVVTDQPQGTDERFRCRDSVYVGEVLKRLIEKDYSEKVREILVVRYQGNPSDRESSYKFFGKALPQLAPNAEVKQFHAALSGGTPALNNSLQDQALRLYRTKCRFYQVVPPSESEVHAGAEKGKIQPVSARPFLRDLATVIVEQLLHRYDYSGALEVLNMFRPIRFWQNEVEAALRHAERRLDLDLKGATQALRRCSRRPPLSIWHQAVSNPDPLKLLVEVYYVAIARFEHREYAEFLWRLRLIFESSKEAILDHLGNPKWERVHNAHTKLGALVGLAGRVLHPMRGRGVTSPRGISGASIAKALKSQTPNPNEVVEVLRTLVEELWRLQKPSDPFPKNPYEEINAFVKAGLKDHN